MVRTRARGRPPKFGRPAQLLALTLPEDVVRWLKGIHPDPAWAIVTLFERSAHRGHPRQPRTTPPVELAEMSARRALIVVDPRSIRSVPGVSVIPVAAGRAFLAFDPGRGLADLELAAVDGPDPTTNAAERSAAAARPRLASLWTLPILDPVDHPRRAQLQARPRALTVSETRQQPGWAIKSS